MTRPPARHRLQSRRHHRQTRQLCMLTKLSSLHHSRPCSAHLWRQHCQHYLHDTEAALQTHAQVSVGRVTVIMAQETTRPLLTDQEADVCPLSPLPRLPPPPVAPSPPPHNQHQGHPLPLPPHHHFSHKSGFQSILQHRHQNTAATTH